MDMTDSRRIIEQAPLSPPNAPTIGQTDQSRIFELVGKRLDVIINGPGSYYPDGVRKAPDALMDDLTSFYDSLEQYGRQLNDPDNIMGHMLDELKRFDGAFAPMANWSASGLQRDKAIELPPELTPKTRDQNYIEIDPFGGPYAPSMPWKIPGVI
jgi:hypothetical protein